MMDDNILDELMDVADVADSRQRVIDAFMSGELPTCKGFIICYIDNDDHGGYYRWHLGDRDALGLVEVVKDLINHPESEQEL